jgi:broad specificity phosphatase PhoE
VEIVLVRHGRPDVIGRYNPLGIVRGRECARLIAEYARSGIDRRVPPPRSLVRRAERMHAAYASSILRAVESAEALGLADGLVVDPLFDEAGIPWGYLDRWKLPVALWMGIARVVWLVGYAPNSEGIGAMRTRARRGAYLLHAAAVESNSVMLVGHGCMNLFIHRELRQLGWEPLMWFRHGHWAANTLTCLTS